MKLSILLFLAVSVCTGVRGQYRVKVVCNPDNHGEYNKDWVNNFIVEYSCDNGRNWQFVNTMHGWIECFDCKVHMHTYEKEAFQDEASAIVFAKHFSSIRIIGRYEANQYRMFLKGQQEDLEYEKNLKPTPKPKPYVCVEKVIY